MRFNGVEIVGFVTCLILIIVQCMTVRKLVKNGEYKGIIKILALLIISTICLSIYFLAYRFHKDYQKDVWQIVRIASYGIGFACLNVAHWLFAFEYYNLIRIRPYAEKDQPVPVHVVKSNNCQYWFWIAVNLATPIAESICLLFYAKALKQPNHQVMHRLKKVVLIGFSLNFFLQIITGIYLGYAIIRIKRIIE